MEEIKQSNASVTSDYWANVYKDIVVTKRVDQVDEFVKIITLRGEQGVFKYCGTDILGTKHFISVGI